MQPLKSFVTGLILASILVLCLLIGCTKAPGFKADPTNPYANPVSPDTTNKVPLIIDFSPKKGLPNTIVTITGNNFDTNPANNTVTVNGVPAAINSVTKVSIVFTVPPSAASGNVVLKSGSVILTSTSVFSVLSGTVSTFFNLGAAYMRHISFDGSGNIFGENDKSVLEISTVSGLITYANIDTVAKALWGIGVNQVFGDVYVADRIAFNIFKISPEKKVSAYAGIGKEGFDDGNGTRAGFSYLNGMTIDDSGNLYVIDGHRVRKIASSGLVTTLAGTDQDGTTDGKGTAARFGSLQGIALDADRNVYVSDAKYLKIRKITPDGTVTTLAGSGMAGFNDGPATTAQFSNPTEMVVDAAGNVLVADGNAALPVFEIRVVNKLGAVSTLLKGTSLTGIINGDTKVASTNAPAGMAFDPAGNLYISNTGANVISKVTFK